MNDSNEGGWLLLIHQMPPKPNYFRVKIWRRLQKLGAVAIKNSVYALPSTDQAVEDLNWVLREIVEGGGEASLVEARLIEGLDDEQVKEMFRAARDADYHAIANDARGLARQLPRKGELDEDKRSELAAGLARLQKRVGEVAALDFLHAVAARRSRDCFRSWRTRSPPACPGWASGTSCRWTWSAITSRSSSTAARSSTTATTPSRTPASSASGPRPIPSSSSTTSSPRRSKPVKGEAHDRHRPGAGCNAEHREDRGAHRPQRQARRERGCVQGLVSAFRHRSDGGWREADTTARPHRLGFLQRRGSAHDGHGRHGPDGGPGERGDERGAGQRPGSDRSAQSLLLGFAEGDQHHGREHVGSAGRLPRESRRRRRLRHARVGDAGEPQDAPPREHQYRRHPLAHGGRTASNSLPALLGSRAGGTACQGGHVGSGQDGGEMIPGSMFPIRVGDEP